MKTEPATRTGWPVWKLAVLFYPFSILAVWINLFFLGLIGTWVGLAAISPVTALIVSVFLGIPATWGFGIWVRRLMDQAEE
ncbi:hypothetical protein [Paracoccus sp. (in: a-proteobacteria)]|uniref:hypothetical protein n=1 Tax=Paracoccus sp. TaxID=267 RepID=UPI0034D01931